MQWNTNNWIHKICIGRRIRLWECERGNAEVLMPLAGKNFEKDSNWVSVIMTGLHPIKLSHWIIKSHWVIMGIGDRAECLNTESSVGVLILAVRSDWCPVLSPSCGARFPHLSSTALPFTQATIDFDCLLLDSQHLYYYQQCWHIRADRCPLSPWNAIVTWQQIAFESLNVLKVLWWLWNWYGIVRRWFGLIDITRYRSLLVERSQSLAVFEFDESSRLFRILPQTGSFALPYYHNTVACSFPPQSAQMSPFLSLFFSAFATVLACVCTCSVSSLCRHCITAV